MKRGKDEDKIMVPMFPRLHVNDTDTGGPRAPPRNKMALYEQLSIPSQRFSHGVLPFNPTNTSNLEPSASSSQVSGEFRFFTYILVSLVFLICCDLFICKKLVLSNTVYQLEFLVHLFLNLHM